MYIYIYTHIHIMSASFYLFLFFHIMCTSFYIPYLGSLDDLFNVYPPPSIHTTLPYLCQNSLLILHTCNVVLFARKTFPLLSHTC